MLLNCSTNRKLFILGTHMHEYATWRHKHTHRRPICFSDFFLHQITNAHYFDSNLGTRFFTMRAFSRAYSSNQYFQVLLPIVFSCVVSRKHVLYLRKYRDIRGSKTRANGGFFICFLVNAASVYYCPNRRRHRSMTWIAPEQ